MLRRLVWSLTAPPRVRAGLERVTHALEETVEGPPSDPPTRTLYQLRLNRPDDHRASTPDTTTSYRPGVDDQELLGLVGRAFPSHPDEQWDQTRLDAERAWPGFTPADVRLAWEGSTLVALCWTRVHDDRDRRLGEIHLIGVAPERGGRGLGPLVVKAGLDHLWSLGASQVRASTETTNRRATTMFVELGFTVFQLLHLFGQEPLTPPHS